MDISCTALPQSRHQCTVTLSAEELQAFEPEALKLMSAELELPGFRKGRVPPDVAKRFVKPEQLFAETIREAIGRTLPRAMAARSLEALEYPDIEVLEASPANRCVYRATIAVMPEVRIGQWRNIRVTRKSPSVSDKELEDALSRLVKSRAKYVAVARPVQNGDYAEVDFEARSLGIKLEGGESKSHPLIVGEHAFPEEFEHNILGMASGEQKTFAITFPSDHAHAAWRGKRVEFTAVLNTVQERHLPKADDLFAQSLGKFQNMDELRKSVREGILAEKEAREMQRSRIEALERIAEQAVLDIPVLLCDREKEKMTGELRRSIEQGGATLEGYLAQIGKSLDTVKAGWDADAKRRVRLALVLKRIAEDLAIEVTDTETEDKTRELLGAYHTPTEAVERIDPQELRAYAKAVVRNEKVFQLLENAVIVEEGKAH